MISTLPNSVTRFGSFYVSSNKIDGAIYGGETTALVWGQMEKFYILMGDHVAKYRELGPQGWQACLDYYRSQPELWSSHSDPLPN